MFVIILLLILMFPMFLMFFMILRFLMILRVLVVLGAITHANIVWVVVLGSFVLGDTVAGRDWLGVL